MYNDLQGINSLISEAQKGDPCYPTKLFKKYTQANSQIVQAHMLD